MKNEQQVAALQQVYDEYDSAAREFKTGAVCSKGCAFCCTHYGNLDITTQEGLVIHRFIHRLPKSQKIRMHKAVARNRRLKEQSKKARCPFLSKNDTCSIYAIRPFSCRQLYSFQKCGDSGPTVHRKAAELANNAVLKLQQLDPCGYSGHISYILHLIKDDKFREFYVNGGFEPDTIRSFAQPRGIVINRAMGDKTDNK